MTDRAFVTITCSSKATALLEECAHRIGESLGAFCREATLERAVEVAEHIARLADALEKRGGELAKELRGAAKEET